MCMIGCCIKSSVSCASASIHVSLHSSICLCLHFVTQGSYLAAQGIECVGERIDSCAWIKARFSVCACICISAGTADTRLINKTAQAILERSFKAGYKYKKCGIVVTGIESINAPQQLDWLNPSDSEQSMMLMQCVDELNARFGKGSMRLGIERLSSNWKMRREKLSPCYTGRFGELLRVR